MTPISRCNAIKIITAVCSFFIAVVFLESNCGAQTLKQGMAIFEKEEQLQTDARSVKEMEKALNLYGQALKIFDRVTGSDSILGAIHQLTGQNRF